MKKGLIGFTGFVGSCLLDQTNFDDLYNSKNIGDIQNKTYDFLLVSGAYAQKWIANKDPENDLENIKKLANLIASTRTKKIFLISTIDVYPNPTGCNENSIIDETICQPYGKNRLFLEKFLSQNFDTSILRLPGLFGHGLRKNIIFDFLNNNQIEKIDSRNVFQFYDTKHLWSDIKKMMELKIPLLNMATQPIETSIVSEICLGRKFENFVIDKPVCYNFKSCYADDFLGKDGYIYSKEEIIEDLKIYAEEFKNNFKTKTSEVEL